MRVFHARRVCLIVVSLLYISTGCVQRGDPGALSNENLRLMRVSAKTNAHLSRGREHKVVNISDESATSLIEALGPIKSAKAGRLPSDAVDYVFGYQAGMDPLVLNVHVTDSHLLYSERKYLYEGGDVAAFRRLAEAILEAGGQGQ
jgi:hypothetical protein